MSLQQVVGLAGAMRSTASALAPHRNDSQALRGGAPRGKEPLGGGQASRLRRQVRQINTSPPSDIASWLDMYYALGDLVTSKVGSHRELVRRDESGELTRSTIGAILRHERSLSHGVLIRVLTVCELSDKEREAWMDAWETLGRPRREAMEDLRCAIAYSRLNPGAPASLPGSSGEHNSKGKSQTEPSYALEVHIRDVIHVQVERLPPVIGTLLMSISLQR